MRKSKKFIKSLDNSGDYNLKRFQQEIVNGIDEYCDNAFFLLEYHKDIWKFNGDSMMTLIYAIQFYYNSELGVMNYIIGQLTVLKNNVDILEKESKSKDKSVSFFANLMLDDSIIKYLEYKNHFNNFCKNLRLCQKQI